MKEIQEIVKAYDAAQKANKKTALATVVHVEGSSYRRPGARMLVTEDGELTGAISGGCLEGDALRKARLVMAQQKSLLVTYDTTDDDDAKLGVGLGCNGIIHILIEPLHPESTYNPVQVLKTILADRQNAVLVTLFSLEDRHAHQPGTCLLQLENEAIQEDIPDERLKEALLADAQEVLQQKSSTIKTYTWEDKNLTAFVEFVPPAVNLVVVGAGNDVMPMVQMANILGWEVIVVDGRANYATTERFPTAKKILVAKADKVLAQLPVDDRTAFALMTHNYNYDIAMLRELININTPYIGSLGPKKKLTRMLEELQEEGIILTEQQDQKVFGPAGLELGAETSEEIALSIIAEIKAILSKKEAGFLRDKSETIHARHPLIMKKVLADESTRATCEIKAAF